MSDIFRTASTRGRRIDSYAASAEAISSARPSSAPEVNGEKLVDWLSRLIAGKPVDDVHCQKCRAG